MKTCTACQKPLAPRNKTGLCVADFNRQRAADPAYRAKLSASLKARLAHDPELRDSFRRRAIALKDLPQTKAAKRERWMADKPWLKSNINRPVGHETRVRAARTQSNTLLADIPPHLRDEYRHLTRTKGFSAVEARGLLADQHELEMARWRRKKGLADNTMAPVAAKADIVVTKFMPLTERAIAIVCNATGLTRDDIMSKSRTREIVRARWVVFNVLRSAGRSLPTIARVLGMKDHASVLHGLRATAAWAEQDAGFASLLNKTMIACKPAIEAAQTAALEDAA